MSSVARCTSCGSTDTSAGTDRPAQHLDDNCPGFLAWIGVGRQRGAEIRYEPAQHGPRTEQLDHESLDVILGGLRSHYHREAGDITPISPYPTTRHRLPKVRAAREVVARPPLGPLDVARPSVENHRAGFLTGDIRCPPFPHGQ
jgi:hypothetical protein